MDELYVEDGSRHVETWKKRRLMRSVTEGCFLSVKDIHPSKPPQCTCCADKPTIPLDGVNGITWNDNPSDLKGFTENLIHAGSSDSESQDDSDGGEEQQYHTSMEHGIESIIEEGCLEDETLENHDFPLGAGHCMNCCRTPVLHNPKFMHLTQHPELGRNYEVALQNTIVPDSSFRQKYSNLRAAQQPLAAESDQLRAVCLCRKCLVYLTASKEEHERNKKSLQLEQLAWPAMIWKFLQSPSVLDVWKLLPELWRAWWTPMVTEIHRNVHNGIQAIPLRVTDSSVERYTLKKACSDNRLADIVCTVNTMLCNVKCPWGCDEFPDDACGLPLDLIYRRLINSSAIAEAGYSGAKRMKYVRSIREDYITAEPSHIGCNPQWPVQPSIYFDKGVPYFATCRFHKNGDMRQYLHPPVHPCGSISSLNPDILSPVQLQCRTVRPFKAHQYSNNFAMHEMRGCAYGLDTAVINCNAPSPTAPDIIQNEQIPFVLNGRDDCRTYVVGISEGIIKSSLSSEVAKSILETSAGVVPMNSNFLEEGATFVTLNDSIKLQERLKYDERPASVITSEKNGQMLSLLFIPPWPKTRVHVHAATGHGAFMPPMIHFPPSVRGICDTRTFWFLAAMHLTVIPLWESTCGNVITTNDWEGWLLTLLTETCIVECGRRSRIFNWTKHRQTAASRILFLMERLGMKHVDDDDEDDDDDNADSVIGNDEAGDGDDEEEGEEFEDSEGLSHPMMASITGDGGESRVHQEDDEEDVAEEDDSSTFSASMVVDEIFNDGTFHSSHLPMLLSNRDDIACIKSDDQDINGQTLQAMQNIALFFCTQKSAASVPPSTILDPSGSTFDLVFIGESKNSISPLELNEWRGTCYARHGGHTFRSWWKLGKDQSRFDAVELQENLPLLYWDYLLYCRNKTPDQKELRHRYLTTIGGQSKAYCYAHDKPMVIQTSDTKLFCSVACHSAGGGGTISCNSRAKFGCSNLMCSAGICLKHFQKLPAAVSYEQRSCIQQSHATSGTDHDSDVDSSSSPEEEENELAPPMHSLNIQEMEMNHLPPASVPYNAFAEECFAAPESMEEEESDLVATIPTTHTGTEPLQFMAPQGSLVECSTQYLPLHVILNCAGGVLARRQFKICGSTKNQHLLQAIVSKSFGQAVPLLHPEGTLFPSIFYKDDGQEGSILGAFPSALLSSNSFLRSHNIASIESHVKCRVMNSTLATHTNTRYLAFLFDLQTNLRGRSCDNRTILHQGFPSIDPSSAIQTPFFYTEQVNSRPMANKLRAAMGEEQCTYFATFTANQKDHFGLRHLKAWFDSEEIIDLFSHQVRSYEDKETLKRTLHENSAILFLRQWTKVATILMNYIVHSSEEPLGKVKHANWIFELQDHVGNLPHIHALIWTEKPTDVARAESALLGLLDRIRGSSYDIIRTHEEQVLLEEGLVSNRAEAEQVRDHARKVLRHQCSPRCQRRYGPGEGETKCRVPNHSVLNPTPNEHTLVPIDVKHSASALKVMELLNLYTYDEKSETYNALEHSNDPELQFLINSLQAWKHSPPAHGGEGPFSPVCSRLFVGTRSAQNLSHPSGYFLARYLLNYICKVDESNYVRLSAVHNQQNAVSVNAEFLHNTKITSSAMHEGEKRNHQRSRLHPVGRAISIFETAMQMLDIPTVYSTQQFLFIQTCPLDLRSGSCQKPSIGNDALAQKPIRPSDISFNSIPTAKLRNCTFPTRYGHNWPEWRTLSDMEIVTLQAQALSKVSLDRPTMFSGRPPELRFVRSIRSYFRWFFRDPKPINKNKVKALAAMEKLLKCDLASSAWIDGFGHRVFIRRAAVDEVLSYLNVHTSNHTRDFYALDHRSMSNIRPQRPARAALSKTTALFQRLKGLCHPSLDSQQRRTAQWSADRICLSPLFFGKADDHANKEIPVIWYNPPPATQATEFLVHVLISLGEFDCELNLYSQGSIKKAFIAAKLLTPGIADRALERAQHEKDVLQILFKWLSSEHRTFPGGTISFDNNLVAAYSTLRRGILDESLPCNELPACIYTRVQEETSRESKKNIELKTETLLRTTRDSVMKKNVAKNRIPNLEELIDAKINTESATNWKAELSQAQNQSDASVEEQEQALQVGRAQLDHYMMSADTQTKCLAFVGGPGVGKTTLLEIMLLEARSRGLQVGVTAVMSDRSIQLGGEHLSKLFCIPVNEGLTPCRIAELAYIRLLRKPKAVAYLLQIDLLVIDELGTLAAETISILDIIMRRLRNSRCFMAGMLVFASYDHKQLSPVTGLPPLLSPHMITSFKFFELKESVRACGDAALQRIQEIARLPPELITEQILNEFRSLVLSECTHVHSWYDPAIKPSTLRVVSTRSAVKEVEKLALDQVKSQQTVLYSKAEDSESTIEGNWVPATAVASAQLDRSIKEVPFLPFYEGAIYEITSNCLRGNFSQSQLAILHEMPSQQQLDAFEPVKVLVAPNGYKTMPDSNTYNTYDDLIHKHQWKRMLIEKAPDFPVMLKGVGIQAKRKQYSLRPRLASTIHCAQGNTLLTLATKVSLHEPQYHLWDKEQAIVLLSRTHTARDIISVNESPHDAVAALCDAIMKESQYSRFMSMLIRNLTSDGPSEIDLFGTHRDSEEGLRNRLPFRPIDVIIPFDHVGYVYMLVSLRDRETVYIGWTMNLHRRFRQHNEGIGARTTCNADLMPWGLMAYVTGFQEEVGDAPIVFEAAWKHHIQQSRATSVDGKANVARTLLSSEAWKNTDLRFISCGTFTGSSH
jgi:predicted GIY-YIG superfamily endonuclease/DNA replication protein DnaC